MYLIRPSVVWSPRGRRQTVRGDEHLLTGVLSKSSKDGEVGIHKRRGRIMVEEMA